MNPTSDQCTRAELLQRIKELELACSQQNYEICQTLGKALGYPLLSDNLKVFPGTTPTDGVCVFEHVAETLADEAARKLAAIGIGEMTPVRLKLRGYKLCQECGQPMLKQNQTRQHPDDYRHATGCPKSKPANCKTKGETPPPMPHENDGSTTVLVCGCTVIKGWRCSVHDAP